MHAERSKNMTNKIAIMQPYVFPYIGYMNLVQASDKFVFYDDVNFIKKGWINRNYIMLMGEPRLFTVPLKGQSQNILIKNTEAFELDVFANKFIQQLKASYKNSNYRDSVLDYVREVLKDKSQTISQIAIQSVRLFFRYVGVKKNFLVSSNKFSQTQGLEKAERLITITQMLGAENYINTIGGISLYSKAFFLSKGVNLQFVKSIIKPYEHCNAVKGNFNPGLSVIDIMMNLSTHEIKNQLMSYELV